MLRPLLLLAALTLAAPASALVEPPVETPIPVGNGFFFDYGEAVATVEFEIAQGGCNGLAQLRIVRHFLGFDKERFVWVDMTCVQQGEQVAIAMVGNEALTPESNLKLVGGGSWGTFVSLSGTYRDGYMSVYLR